MFTPAELEAINLPIEDTGSKETSLYIDAALDWLLENTIFDFDKTDIELVKLLPSGAKLFLCKYKEIMSQNILVTSESISGLSQSFNNASKQQMLLQLARELMPGYMKSDLQFIPSVKRWDTIDRC